MAYEECSRVVAFIQQNIYMSNVKNQRLNYNDPLRPDVFKLVIYGPIEIMMINQSIEGFFPTSSDKATLETRGRSGTAP